MGSLALAFMVAQIEPIYAGYKQRSVRDDVPVQVWPLPGGPDTGRA